MHAFLVVLAKLNAPLALSLRATVSMLLTPTSALIAAPAQAFALLTLLKKRKSRTIDNAFIAVCFERISVYFGVFENL